MARKKKSEEKVVRSLEDLEQLIPKEETITTTAQEPVEVVYEVTPKEKELPKVEVKPTPVVRPVEPTKKVVLIGYSIIRGYRLFESSSIKVETTAPYQTQMREGKPDRRIIMDLLRTLQEAGIFHEDELKNKGTSLEWTSLTWGITHDTVTKLEGGVK